MDANLIQLQGILTAQSHLIELLLGAKMASDKNPVALVEQLRKLLDHQFRFNMAASSKSKSHLELSAIQTAALNHLHEIFDNMEDRLARLRKSSTA